MTDPKESIGTDSRDMNRDPISGAPGSHPVGVGVGGVAGGAAAGALAGTFFGPIGTLVGAAVGVIAGAATGKGVAERIDPTGETEYWRQEYTNRPYVEAGRDFDRDYASAYGYGLQARETNPGRSWDQTEEELQRNWNSARDTSSLDWEQARGAVRDSWERADRTYSTYEDSDRYFASRFDTVDYRGGDDNFDEYRPAYRYGTQARTRYQDREWDDGLERELKEGWDKTADTSRMTWERAKNAVKDAFSSDDKYSSNRRS